MSGIRKHDWGKLVQEWVQEKFSNRLLTQSEFFRTRGIAIAHGNRRIGKKMAKAWTEAQQQATNQVIKKVGLDLAAELERQLKVGTTALATGARNILPRRADDGSEIPPTQQPQTFSESLALAKFGAETTREVIKLLTGEEPLLPPDSIKGVMEWVPPALPPPKKTEP